MNDERKHKWLPVLFFMLTGMLIGVSIYLISASAVESEARAHGGNPGVAATAGAAPSGTEARVRVVLQRDIRNSFGKVDLVYRGVEHDQLKLDVFIRDLDPDYAYRREIDLRAARGGFRLGGVHFELVSAGRTKAKLVWVRRG